MSALGRSLVFDPNHCDEALMDGATMPERAAPRWLIEAMRRGFSDMRLAPRDRDEGGAADDCCADGEQADEQAEDKQEARGVVPVEHADPRRSR
jgi:hypothetical protein